MFTEHIDMVGVELEGGWDRANAPPGIKPDGSVSYDRECCEEPGGCGDCGDMVGGEIALAPARFLRGLRTNVKKFYPDEVDNSCGLHIHMSLPDFSPLLDVRFERCLFAELFRWGRKTPLRAAEKSWLWNRLKGKNSYCGRFFLSAIGSREDVGNRYLAVNTRTLHRNTKTIEIRVLPMFQTPERALSAIETVINFTEDWCKDPPEFEVEYKERLNVRLPLKLGAKRIPFNPYGVTFERYMDHYMNPVPYANSDTPMLLCNIMYAY